MCLITKQKDPTFLKKDLVVYKIIIKGRDLKSYIREFKYETGRVYKTTIISVDLSRNLSYADYVAHLFYYDRYDCNVYETGFHFYKNKKRIKQIERELRNYQIVRCIIPKNSIVYFDETGLGVSNQIIIEKKVRPYRKTSNRLE